MNRDFERYKRELSTDDLKSFEALCFHRADEVAEPYTALMNAPKMAEKLVTAPLVKRAWENSEAEIQRAYETDTGSGAKIFAYAVARLVEGPGCVPSLISANNPEKLDLFECNIQQELGGPLDTTFSGLFGSGLTWDSFHFFQDAFGEGTSINVDSDHLTKLGLEFAQWLWPERIEALRRQAETRG
jgi:hypothetical protein